MEVSVTDRELCIASVASVYAAEICVSLSFGLSMGPAWGFAAAGLVLLILGIKLNKARER